MLYSLQQYRKLFLTYLQKIRGYSDLTLKTYNETLKEMLQIIELEENNKITTINLMPYRIKISKLKQKTIAKKLSAIRSFVKFLNTQDEKVILSSIDSIKVPKTLPKPVFTKHIIEALHQANLQENLIILMLYTLGLRISELSNVLLCNINGSWVRVYGKGSKQRDIPLLDITSKAIGQYIKKYQPKKYLFEKKGEKLSENSLRYIVVKVFKKISLKVTPHQLRHSYATDLLNSGARITDVSELLGHSSITSTQIYTKLATSLKMKNYKDAHPLQKETDVF